MNKYTLKTGNYSLNLDYISIGISNKTNLITIRWNGVIISSIAPFDQSKNTLSVQVVAKEGSNILELISSSDQKIPANVIQVSNINFG
jgi:hypothetical protein